MENFVKAELVQNRASQKMAKAMRMACSPRFRRSPPPVLLSRSFSMLIPLPLCNQLDAADG